MRLLRRVPLAASALLLAGYAGLAAMGAARLHYAGAGFLYAAAAILALAAVGLAFAEPAARAFAVLFFLTTAVLYAAVAVAAAGGAFDGSGGSGWEGLRVVALGTLAVLAGLACALSAAAGATLLFLGRDEVRPAFDTQVVAWILGAGGVVALAWIGGYQFWYRSLLEQDACLGGGSAARCTSLARNDRFAAEERLAFARTGCERGHTGSCAALTQLLGKDPARAGDEPRVLQAQCERGNADVCLRLGTYLLGTARDVAGAEAAFARGCAAVPGRCRAAAEAAEQARQPEMAQRLLEAGCDRDEPYSCRALLRRLERSRAERAALQLKVCLITDVNECKPLIEQDAAKVCPLICEGATDNRKQSCDQCGRHLAESGQLAQAEAWLGPNCEKGYLLSCINLGKLHQERGEERRARAWFEKACDRERFVTVGCSYLRQ
jgi:hypothetical protein